MRYTNQASFIKALKSSDPDHLSRVYCIAMADDFERGQVIKAILERLMTPDRSLKRFSASSFEPAPFFDHLQTPSLFGGEPIAVLEEAEKLPKKQTLLSAPLSYGYLIVGARAKTPLLTHFEQEGIVLDLLEEKPWEREKRITEELHFRASQAGKAIDPDALSLLFERLDKDSAILQSELDKLICYSAESPRITAEDVRAISASNKTYSFWQTAEEIIWEGTARTQLDDASFHPLIPALRSQLQLGLKIASLIEAGTDRQEWNQWLGRIYPRTLDKRISQAARLGSAYFSKGLHTLFDIELQSRTGSQQYAALLDLFRTNMIAYAPR